MKWTKKTGASQPSQFSDMPSEAIVATVTSDQPQEKSGSRTLFSICNNVLNRNYFEAFLASLVLKSLLLPNDLVYLRANQQVWDDLSQLYKNTKKFRDWADGEKGVDGQEMDDYIPMELLVVMFEPVKSTPALWEFGEESRENWVLLHVITAPLRKSCVNAVAKLRTSGRGIFVQERGLVITPHGEKRGQAGFDTSSILKEARRVGLSWLEKQDHESVTALVKDGMFLLEKVRK
ncbi:hypothetical protein E2P81_ATG00481 [Venturia nashicola]|uniref:Uncharacterized protein n=1 Tax=Venturia nashicola TaxID=86259 RepID=A0A4Z1PNY0_9PEZI|nr:hypothetical protein E6O75_ATG00491 [Venturia nashicola]TLD39494.1 hypothetical protein E2P81_ATG00481 [Venturia nashicola]